LEARLVAWSNGMDRQNAIARQRNGHRRRLRLCTALVVTLVAAGTAMAQPAKWGPTWSEVTGKRESKVTMNNYDAIIKSVDGRHDTSRVVKIEPGKRTIVVQSPTRKGFRGSDQTMELAAEPCVRYYVTAQFESGVGPDWHPVVSRREPIPGCKAGAEGAAPR
jgi:hypothetical protein